MLTVRMSAVTAVTSTLGSWGLLTSIDASNIGALIGVAALIGGVGAVARYREGLRAANAELVVLKSRDERLMNDNVRLEAQVAALQARPNLDKHAELLDALLLEFRSYSDRSRSRDEEIIAALATFRP